MTVKIPYIALSKVEKGHLKSLSTHWHKNDTYQMIALIFGDCM